MGSDLPPKPSRAALVALCRDDPERAADLILTLWAKVDELTAVVEAQGKEIAELKAKLGKDSHNSSKPPSSDGHNPGGGPADKGKQKRKGKARARKSGGQPGHRGKTLEASTAPDHVVELPRPSRCGCGAGLAQAVGCGDQRRQVFDLPPEIKIEVTEYRAPVCRCPGCGKSNVAAFPEGVRAPVQYGERIRAAATYLHVYHLLPFERLGQVFGDLFGCGLATGTLSGFIADAAARAAPTYARIREEVTSSDFMHNDETGLKVLAKTSWLHVASTPHYAYFEVTPGRSFEDIKSVGVFGGYTGRIIHDFLPAYFKFEGVKHGLCNAHHLRDLTFVEEHHGQRWPVDMKALLLEAKALKDREVAGGREVDPKALARLRRRYAEVLALGRTENPEPVRDPSKRGRPARGKALNLLDRFTEHEGSVLAFLTHRVPFDNNEAERDLRMMKTRQKISGCFRSLDCAKRFAKIRSLITSAKKRSVDAYELLQQLFSNPKKAELMLFET